MIVVSDALPIHYLVLIGKAHVLPALYGRVIVPAAVAEELSRSSTPAEVRAWIEARPEWIEVRTPTAATPVVEDLHAGERMRLLLQLN